MASNFEKLASALAKRPGVRNPGGLAYAIGAKKYGRPTMQKAAAQGKPAKLVAREKKSY